MDDDALDDHLETDADSFGEWIEQVAASRGISEDEFLNQLMSSYWMMDELATVIDELDIDAGRGRASSESVHDEVTGDTQTQRGPPRQADNQPPSGEQQPGQSPAATEGGVIDLIETLKGWETTRDQPDPSAVDDNLIDLIKVIQEGNQAGSSSQSEAPNKSGEPAEAGSGGIKDTVQLIRALKEFGEHPGGSNIQEQLATQRKYWELDEQFDELESDVEGLTRTVESLDQTNQERTAELARELDRVTGRVAELDEELQNAADAKRVDKLQDSVGDLADEITSIRSEIDAQSDEIESEFENVEQILTHLFDEVEETAAETDTLKDQLGSIQTRLETLDDLERAGDLKRKANRAGVSEASCESCGESVVVGQLTEPECPYCNTEYDGLVEDRKWGIFSHHILTQENGDAGE